MTERVKGSELGHVVRELRHLNGVTQRDVAEAVGWKSPHQIMDLENGNWNPTKDQARKIIEVLIATDEDAEKVSKWL